MLLVRVCCPRVTLVCPLSSPVCGGLGPQVSETEREDLEESEKIQYWVERLCQTRLEQISSAENEISEVTEAFFLYVAPPAAFRMTHPGNSERQDGHCPGPPLPAHFPSSLEEGEHICFFGLISTATTKSQLI